jgi:hypothetical protein
MDDNQNLDQTSTDPTDAQIPDPNSETAIATLQKERSARKELEKKLRTLEGQLQAFNGIDPDKAREAERIAKEIEERSQWESKIKAEIEAQYQPKISEYQKQLDERDRALVDYQRDNALEKSFYAAGGYEGEFDAIAHLLRGRVQAVREGGSVSFRVLDGKGQPMYVKGDPATMQDLVDDLKTHNMAFARHFRGSEKAGFGITGNGAGVPPGSLDGLDPWEKVARLRELKGRA